MALNDKITELKLQLHFAKKQNVQIEKKVNSLRSKIYILTEETGNLNSENGFFVSQISEMSSEISQLKCQMAIIDVCKISENSKRDVQLTQIDKHKNGYDAQFDKERAVPAVQKEQTQQKEGKEVERQKMAKLLEKNEQQVKDTAVIEHECDAIERQCSILVNRNKAIMYKLRRKLIETEKKRRQLMKRNKC